MWLICEATGTISFQDPRCGMDEAAQVPPNGRFQVTREVGSALIERYPYKPEVPTGFREAEDSDDVARERLQMFESRHQRAKGPVAVESPEDTGEPEEGQAEPEEPEPEADEGEGEGVTDADN